eukprot:TRINITY_DN8229_c0_g2_i1.p1 TRINITY_DN8229_c0_g2~~TRINITY_DN8229_c0_g2_i1.p1  ORF type:complete len:359 (+),score=61.36 TRINITY_DN8229_c0_g2_i1:58-1077(+)
MDDGGDLSHADCYTECGDYRDIPFRQWETSEVCAWLESLNVSQHTVEAFRTAQIEGGLLQFLSEQVLREDLCVYNRRDRHTVLTAVRELLISEREAHENRKEIRSSTSLVTDSQTSHTNSWATSGRSADSKWYIGQKQARFMRKRKWLGPSLLAGVVLVVGVLSYYALGFESTVNEILYIALLIFLMILAVAFCAFFRFNIMPEEVVINRAGIRTRGAKLWYPQPITWTQEQIHYVTLETTSNTRHTFVMGKYQRVQVAVYVVFKQPVEPAHGFSCWDPAITRIELPLRHDDETYAIEASQRIAYLLGVPYLLKAPNDSTSIKQQTQVPNYTRLNYELP